jgi:hypothetical protein
MDLDPGPDGARPRDQLCVVSCQGNGVAYYWSVIDARARNAIGFRGFSAAFPATGVAREVLDFTIQGPLIPSLSDLEDVTQLQAIEIGGGAAASSGQQLAWDAKILVAPAPQLAPHGRNPHGAVLSVKNETEGTTIATIADFHRGDDWVFALLVAAIPVVAVNGGQVLIDAVIRGSMSSGNLVATITTPIGKVTVNKPFTAVPGLPAEHV